MSQRWRYTKTEPTPGKVCKDCTAEGIRSVRPAPHPGPRCRTHHLKVTRERRLTAAGRRRERVYGVSPELYAGLLAFQGGRCAICLRATGKTKALAVDHDHDQALRDGHPHDQGCPNCVRGLVCGPCNDVLAHFRSNPDTFARGAAYLAVPPMRRLQCSPSPGDV